ncbi:hypothetical protein CRU86_08565 [Aliarcobacter skirrowii]|uniref:hypothetical protein n=1 Tax=Aliarcobacter skirrowii TaxID=28200 RepID=UPI00100B3628|nr:hypothetical protein [Aliarcobacter skirrowii]RXJ75331.1 hypothetical protein CRU86_08565 [Aliarcobacter skirrowii]
MFEQIIVGLVVVLVGALVVFIFKIRQLYITVPRLFTKTKLSDNGNIAEINIYNKSKMMEEDIKINLNDELKYEILSTTLDDLKLNKNILSVTRLSASDKISVLLLIENGNFSKNDIKSILSKSTKGKIINEENLPVNYGNLFISVLIVMLLLFAPSKLFDLYDNYQLSKVKKEYSFLENEGFYDYDRYLRSEIIKFYSKNEFPIYKISNIKEEDIIILEYRLINNLATEMRISIRDDDYLKELKNTELHYKYIDKIKGYYDFILKPKEYKDIKIYAYFPKDSERKEIHLKYSIRALDELMFFSEKIDINKIKNSLK